MNRVLSMPTKFLCLLTCGAICGLISACTTGIHGMNSSTNNNPAGPPVQLKFSIEPSISAGAGIAFTTEPVINIEDANGNVVTSATNTVTLTAYTDAACTVAAVGTFAATINPLAASSGTVVFAGVNYGGVTTTIYVGASSSGLTSACSSAVTIMPGNPAKLIFSIEPADPSATAGVNLARQPAVTVEDTYGNVVTSATNSVTLAAYTNSTCTTAGTGTFNATTNPLTPASGVATFAGVNYTKSGTFYIGASSSGLTSACSNSISVAAGPPAKLAWSWGYGNTSLVNGCEPTPGPISGIEVQDSYGNVATVTGSTLTISLVGGGSTVWYSNSTCTTSITTATIPVGSSSTGTLYLSDSAVETVGEYATATGLTPISPMNNAWELKPVLSFSPPSFTAGSCEPFTITTEDANGTVMAVPANNTLTIGNYGSRSTIYSNNTCTTAIPNTSLTIASGQSTVTYYLIDDRAENITNAFINWSTNLETSSPSSFTVGPAIPADLALTGPTFEPPSTCSGPYTVTSTDGYGNPSNITGSALTVNLSATGSGAFYTAAGCSTPTTSVSIGVGASSQTFYVEDAATEISTLTAAATSFTSGTFNFDSIATSPLQQVAVGGDFTCVLINGGVKCWGDNTYGELGNGTTTSSLTPVAVSGLTSVSNVVAAQTNAKTSTGLANGLFACALKTDSTIWCWGAGGNGELGNGLTSNSSTPVEVTISGTPLLATQISAGGYEACAVTSGGALYCWGGGGTDMPTSSTPQEVLISGAVSVAASDGHACVIEIGGDLKCFGNDGYNDLGNSPSVASSTPAQVYGLTSGVTSTGVSGLSSCAVVSGAVKCWSTVAYGQDSGSSTPSPVGSPMTSGVSSVIGGGESNDYFFAITSSGALYGWGGGCCGSNQDGILGAGTPNVQYSSSSPYRIIANGVQSASVTDYGFTGCAIVSGNLQCWADNRFGQAGTNTINDNYVPVYTESLE